MYQLDNNTYELMELKTQMHVLESKMNDLGIDPKQTQFDMKSADSYRK
jgi:hypothetical protein